MRRRRHARRDDVASSRWMTWAWLAAWIGAVGLAVAAGFTAAEIFWAWVIRR